MNAKNTKQQQLSVKEYMEIMNKPKLKFGNIRTETDGIVFDSKKEADYYCELKMLLRCKQIKRILYSATFHFS